MGRIKLNFSCPCRCLSTWKTWEQFNLTLTCLKSWRTPKSYGSSRGFKNFTAQIWKYVCSKIFLFREAWISQQNFHEIRADFREDHRNTQLNLPVDPRMDRNSDPKHPWKRWVNFCLKNLPELVIVS